MAMEREATAMVEGYYRAYKEGWDRVIAQLAQLINERPDEKVQYHPEYKSSQWVRRGIEAAAYCRISAPVFDRALARGELPYSKWGDEIVIKKADIDALMTRRQFRKVNGKAVPVNPPPPTPASASPRRPKKRQRQAGPA